MIFMLNLQRNRKNALDKILKRFVNCTKFLLSDVFDLQKVTVFIFVQLIW